MLEAGEKAPSFTLPSVEGGDDVTDPWTEGPVVLAFFKTSCPVCKMVAPMLTKLSDSGVRVITIGEDPPDAITVYNETHNQQVPALTQGEPYSVSRAYGLEAVPTIFLIAENGEIKQAIAGWNRDTWNALAADLGLTEPLSTPDDGLRPFRPG